MDILSFHRTRFLLFLFVICSSVFSAWAKSYKRVCYYTNWAQYRPGEGKFFPDNIDASLCTHIVYAFADINPADINNDNNPSIIHYEWNDPSYPWGKGNWEKVIEKKEENPNLKVLIGIGGWNFGVDKYRAVAKTAELRQAYADAVVTFCREIGFDGYSVDWEYPGQAGQDAGRPTEYPEDKETFVLFMQTLYETFERDAEASGLERLILAVDVSSGEGVVADGYDAISLANYVDWVAVFCYDFHGQWHNVTGHNAGLFAANDAIGDDPKLTLQWSINNWLASGMPPDKLLSGIPTYGRSFRLKDTTQTGFGAPTYSISVPGEAHLTAEPGKFTRESGFLSYYEVCDIVANQGGNVVFDEEQRVPYMYRENLWVGHDNLQSIEEKMNWIKDRGIDGVMIWAMDLDDFSGKFCNQGPFPLLSLIKEMLPNDGDDANAETTTKKPTTTTRMTTEAGTRTTAKAATTKKSTTTTRMTTEAGTRTTARAATTKKPTTTTRMTTKAGTRTTAKAAITKKTETIDCSTNTNQLYPHADCHMYYQCQYGKPLERPCASGTVFVSSSQNCEHESPSYPCTVANVETTTKKSTTTTRMTTEAGTRTTAKAATTKKTETIDCSTNTDQLYPHADCHKYYQCQYGKPLERDCASGTVFVSSSQNCEHEFLNPYLCTVANVETTTKKPATTTRETTTTQPPAGNGNGCPYTLNSLNGIDCAADGDYCNPADCATFFKCSGGLSILFPCPAGLAYNRATGNCDWPANVEGCN